MLGPRPSRMVLLGPFFLCSIFGCDEPPAAHAGARSPPRPSSAGPEVPPSATPPVSAGAVTASDTPSSFERGFVVWESNRSGEFRIWRAELGSGAARQISPDEPGRDHCCAKLSPDGRRLVYLSLPAGERGYRNDILGELRLADADGGRDRALAAAARHYGEHRAAVWWGLDELVHLDATGATVRRVLSTGETETLARPGSNGEGWLIAPGGRFATTNTPTFSDFDRARGVAELPSLGGCQPAFSADGGRAVWSAGAGGPIDAIDLATRESWSIVGKNDPRLPEGRRYAYFPQISADSTLLALAASPDEHDHFRSDYDVLIFEIDPETLEPTANARILAPHPAVDRFPDPFRRPAREPGSPPLSAARRSAPVDAAPTDRERGLVLIWERGDLPNRVTKQAPTTLLRPAGRAWLDRNRSMALGGGSFGADGDAGERLGAALRSTNQFTLALRIAPANLEQDGAIVALSNGVRRRSLLLRQRGRTLELTLRNAETPRTGTAVRLAELSSLGPTHLAVTFSPGRLNVFVDGEPAGPTQPVPGDFFHWKPTALSFGIEPGDDSTWRGAIANVAFWNRPLSRAEAQREAALSKAPAAVERMAIEARVLRSSPAPSLESISPYREALAVDEIEVVQQLSGPGLESKRLRRVRWAILDGQLLPAPRSGEILRLVLEPFAEQPQLEPLYLADEIGGSLPLWFDLGGSAER